jgi:hypothetical protein
MKKSELMVAGIRLFHRKESEAFLDLHARLCLRETPPKRKGSDVCRLWFWGMHRWGKIWCDTEYAMKENGNELSNHS